jgi:hypothetical protein
MRLAEPERGEQSRRSENIGPANEGIVALAGKMCGPATRHAASMGWLSAERHRKPIGLN